MMFKCYKFPVQVKNMPKSKRYRVKSRHIESYTREVGDGKKKKKVKVRGHIQAAHTRVYKK
jgi:hypothetical protein